ncbi:MAG: sulfotransferase, partial [Parafilimonas sp.]
MQDPIIVIYIISDRRSGSTLLENILSKSNETVSVGELAMLKGHIIKEGPGEIWNWNCSCGKPVLECEFWSKVLAGIYDENFETKISWPYKSSKALSAALLPALQKNALLKFIHTKKNKQTIEQLNKVYVATSNISAKKFIVDSSKDPMQALAVSECKNVEAKFIWLSRDLRAITFSKLKRWKVNKRSTKKPLETLTDSFYYKKICAATLQCINKNNSIKIDYEALAANPQKELDKICNKFGIQKY